MHWQFGGNLEPVQMICEVDWRECPKAIANYIWSEIVTDVLDCLRNESMVWRVLAAFLLCILLLRIIYSKTNYPDEKVTNGEVLNKVGYKVEDLELKVNVLTYKLQYGCWPLPHQVQKSNFRKNLRNLRLTLSNPNDRDNWIKHVLLSPRKNESYVSYAKYCPSEYRVKELFDAKKRAPIYPYLRQQNLPMEHSSKSSKSSSDKSLKLSPILENLHQKQRDALGNENFEVQRRNAISLPLFSKKRKNKFRRKTCQTSKCTENERATIACKKFTKTMDDCKRYLKQLHDSNRNLGLICSSSDISDETSIKNFWSDTQVGEQEKLQEKLLTIRSTLLQQQRCVEKRYLDNVSDDREENKGNENECQENAEKKNFSETDRKQRSKDQSLDLSNAIYPVLKLIDKRLLPSNMNITFCSDMFDERPTSNMLIPKSCERKKFMETSRETLYQVKKKLESLHNVLRMYELQKGGIATTPEKQREHNNKINSISQHPVDILVPVTTGTGGYYRSRTNKINLNEIRSNCREMQITSSNSSEQSESDETSKSSVVSIRNYSNVFNAYRVNNINEHGRSFGKRAEFKMSVSNDHELIQSNRYVHLSTVKYERIPERVYYALSSDSSEGMDINKETNVLPDLYVESNQRSSLCLSDQYPAPMETDEDVIISPRSSQTEVSKDSEFEDKSTALLIQEALQFKQALLTRVELQDVYYIDNKLEEINSEFTPEHDKYFYINKSLQSKILDIISEEQSVSSSTEKTSRTYMFFNLKQDQQIKDNILNFVQQSESNEIEDTNVQKEYLESKQNLASPSEYFSISNIQEEIGGNDRQSLPKHNHLRENESTEVIPSSLQLKYLNVNLDKSDENLTAFSSCMNGTESNTNKRNTCYAYVPQKRSFEEHFTRMNSINEFIYRSINSVELFSQNLDEPVLEEEVENSTRIDASNFVNTESLQQYSSMQYTGNTEDMLNSQPNTSDENKYIEDHEISTGSPNLALKRNPGACSLIEHTQNTNVKERTEMHDRIENEVDMYELSHCESKETSFEINLIQDSLTSSVNNSNDSNIPEPPSVTELINKSLDEEKLDLNWSNDNNDFNDHRADESDQHTFSADTITLENNNTRNIDEYKETEGTYNEKEKLQEENNDSAVKNSYTYLKEGLDNELYKSYCNLVSPRSSIYFTDEASSSTTKFNNVYTTNMERYSHSTLCPRVKEKDNARNKDRNSGEIPNIENTKIQSTSVPNERKEINVAATVSSVKASIKEFDNQQNSTKSKLLKACTEDTNTSPRIERNSPKDMDGILNNNATTSYNKTNNYSLLSTETETTDRARSNWQMNRAEKLNMEQYIIWTNMSTRKYSPRDTSDNKSTNKMRTTVKSRSHENYTPQSEKIRGQNSQHGKGLRSDSSNTVQRKRESNANSTYTKPRDLSAEAIRNKESTIKLDKRRSRSQISFRTTESPKQAVPRSHESPRNMNPVNCAESIGMKSKLKGYLKPLSPTPKTSSRSCIPILKSRLEAARKSENESRPKSPMRGPLTMTVFCRDNLCKKNQNVAEDVQVEGETKNNELCMQDVNDYAEKAYNNQKQDSINTFHTVQDFGEPSRSNIAPQDQMVIYVNIFTKYDHNSTKIVDPNKFLEYMKNRNISIEKLQKSQASVKGVGPRGGLTENENDTTMRNVVTVVSSVTNGNEPNRTASTSLSGLKTRNDSVASILLSGKLKNLCFLSVEQREIDVTAKPSVIDTSTSISDLENISDQSKSLLNKFQICGTPEELSNEEYIGLLEILYQEPNYVHLQELQNVCTKLVSERQKSK